IKVIAAPKPNRIFRNKSPDLRLIVSGSIIIEPCVWVPLSAGKSVIAPVDRADLEQVPKGVVLVGVDYHSCLIGNLHDTAQSVGVIVRENAIPILPRQGLIDAGAMDEEVRRRDTPDGAEIAEDIFPVVGVLGRDLARSLLDAADQRVI